MAPATCTAGRTRRRLTQLLVACESEPERSVSRPFEPGRPLLCSSPVVLILTAPVTPWLQGRRRRRAEGERVVTGRVQHDEEVQVGRVPPAAVAQRSS